MCVLGLRLWGERCPQHREAQSRVCGRRYRRFAEGDTVAFSVKVLLTDKEPANIQLLWAAVRHAPETWPLALAEGGVLVMPEDVQNRPNWAPANHKKARGQIALGDHTSRGYSN